VKSTLRFEGPGIPTGHWSALPFWSTARHDEMLGQETLEITLAPSTLVGPDQEEPFQERALPLSSTAMQKVVVGQETLEITLAPSTLVGLDQEVPFQERALPP